jgi:hypothetical protein
MKISEKLLDFFNNPRVYKILRLLRKIIGESGTNSFAFTHFCLCINYTQPLPCLGSCSGQQYIYGKILVRVGQTVLHLLIFVCVSIIYKLVEISVLTSEVCGKLNKLLFAVVFIMKII